MWLGIHRSRLAWLVGLVALQLCACQLEPLGTSRGFFRNDADEDAGAVEVIERAERPDSGPDEFELASGTVQREDGEPCATDGECASDHCDSGLCCAEGECCRSGADCAGGGEVALICDRPADCQGIRGRYACQEHRCRMREVEDDDSACTDEVKVDGCGAYRSVYCSGESEQSRPRCPEACSDDADCDPRMACSGGACDAPDVVSESMPEPEAEPEAECETDGDCDSGRCTEARCCRPESEDCPSERTGSAGEQQRCRDILARNVVPEACRECACERCAVSALGCFDSGDRSLNMRCSSVTTCGLFSGCLDECDEANASCLGERCYCGQGNSSCAVPYGPCVESITAAGETGDPEQLLERTGDREYPLYYATQFAECMTNECGRECVATGFSFLPF
jgi:hypothetical protein